MEKTRLERRSSERRKKSSLRGEESYKPCDFCGRKFCENAFERHVEWCRLGQTMGAWSERENAKTLPWSSSPWSWSPASWLDHHHLDPDHHHLDPDHLNPDHHQIDPDDAAGRKAADCRLHLQKMSRLWQSWPPGWNTTHRRWQEVSFNLVLHLHKHYLYHHRITLSSDSRRSSCSPSRKASNTSLFSEVRLSTFLEHKHTHCYNINLSMSSLW